MKFASTRLIASDITGMVAFYELVTGCRADWLAPVFAEIVTPGASLAIGSAETVASYGEAGKLQQPGRTGRPFSSSWCRTSMRNSHGSRTRSRSCTHPRICHGAIAQCSFLTSRGHASPLYARN